MNSSLKSFNIQKILALVSTAGFILYAILRLILLGRAYDMLYPIIDIVSALLMGISSLFLFKYTNSQEKCFSAIAKPGAALVFLFFGILTFVTGDFLDIFRDLFYIMDISSKIMFFARILAMLFLVTSVFCFYTNVYKPATMLSVVSAVLMLLSIRGIGVSTLFTLAIIAYSVVIFLSSTLHKKLKSDNYQAALENSFEADFLRNVNNSDND